MGYFMETMDRKSIVQQLELHNKKLQIEKKKVRSRFFELKRKFAIQEVDEDGEEEGGGEAHEELEKYVGVGWALLERHGA